MAKRKTAQASTQALVRAPEPAAALEPGALVYLPGGRVGEWVSIEEEGTTFRTEHFRTVDSLGLLLRNGAITVPMHDAGQEFNRTFVFAQMEPVGSPALDRIPGGQWRDNMTERCAFARKRLGQALDAVGGITSPGGCVVWHVAGLGKSVREWAAQEGWNGRSVNEREAKGILIGALAILALHYGHSR